VAYACGLKALLTALTDEGNLSNFETVVDTLMNLYDSPDTRKVLRPFVEMEATISHFTDAYTAKGAYNMDKLSFSGKIIEEILKSWPGMYYFGVSGGRSIKAIVEALSHPDAQVRNVLLTMLKNVLIISDTGNILVVQEYALKLLYFVEQNLIEAKCINSRH
jgi:hypothetical protein